jgi:hypothetical protein
MVSFQREEIIQRLLKVQALAQRGEAGEKEAASRMLRQIMEKYNLTESDLAGLQYNWYKFSYRTAYEKQLLYQILVSVRTHVRATKPLHRAIEAELLPEQYEKAVELYTILRSMLKDEFEMLYTAFINKHNIFPDEAIHGDDEAREELDIEKLLKITKLMASMSDMPHKPPPAAKQIIMSD